MYNKVPNTCKVLCRKHAKNKNEGEKSYPEEAYNEGRDGDQET